MRFASLCVAAFLFLAVTPAVAAPPKIVTKGLVRVEMQPNNTFVTKVVRNTELAASYPVPPKPSPTHACKRADLHTQVIGARGGEVYTKGGCKGPLKAVFQLTKNVQDQAGRACRMKFAERKRKNKPLPKLYSFLNKFQGKIHIRYCFLDMKAKKGKWHVDCGKDGIHREYTTTVPYTINCVPAK